MKSTLEEKKIANLATGPSLLEVEYLQQLKQELEIFLKSKNFSTIKNIQIGFEGRDYAGKMRISA